MSLWTEQPSEPPVVLYTAPSTTNSSWDGATKPGRAAVKTEQANWNHGTSLKQWATNAHSESESKSSLRSELAQITYKCTNWWKAWVTQNQGSLRHGKSGQGKWGNKSSPPGTAATSCKSARSGCFKISSTTTTPNSEQFEMKQPSSWIPRINKISANPAFTAGY